MITCKACYYSKTVRTLPSGCTYKCGMGRGSEKKKKEIGSVRGCGPGASVRKTGRFMER